MKSDHRVMAPGRVGSAAALGMLCAALACLVAPLSATAQDPFAGNIRSVESDDPTAQVKVIRQGYSGVIAGKPGSAVFIGDTLKTAAGMKVQIELSDATMITLAPNSSVQVKGHLIEKSRGKRNSVLRTLKGTVRFVVAKFFRMNGNGGEGTWKDSQVTIETLNAVAGVRGTDIVVTADQDATEIAVLDGALHVRSSLPSLRGDVLLGANQVSSVRKGSAPSQPAGLSAERRETLIKATTVERPRTAADAGAPDGPQKKKKASEKDVARDLAAGMALGLVLDKAVESGMGIDEAVAAALNAGASPSAVVYTAIIEGYPVNAVVRAAIENGAPLTIVVSAALGAGGDPSLIIAGLTDAGVPPAAIANAMAWAASPSAPGNGDGYPRTLQDYIPPEKPMIGGGGGAPPSTQPASPYKP